MHGPMGSSNPLTRRLMATSASSCQRQGAKVRSRAGLHELPDSWSCQWCTCQGTLRVKKLQPFIG